MTKLAINQKQEITPGVGIGAIVFGLLTIVFGVVNIVGAVTAGTKNIEIAKKQAPEKVYTNSVFTNSYRISMH